MMSYSNLLLAQNYRSLETGIKVHVSGLGCVKERKYHRKSTGSLISGKIEVFSSIN